MIGCLRSTMQKLGAAAALVFALSLAGPGMSQAAPSKASPAGYVNGLPCNALCKVYMAWSDRIMGRSSRPPPKARIAVRHRKPERTAERAAAMRHSDLNSFAQILRRSDTAPQAAETPQVTAAAPPAPVNAIAEPLSPATGIAAAATARPADDGSATSEPPRTTLAAFATAIPATQATSTRQDSTPQDASKDASTPDDFARSDDRRLAVSLGLMLCALLSLLCWVWFRHRTQAANTIG